MRIDKYGYFPEVGDKVAFTLGGETRTGVVVDVVDSYNGYYMGDMPFLVRVDGVKPARYWWEWDGMWNFDRDSLIPVNHVSYRDGKVVFDND